MKQIILASQSPRRKEFMEKMGLDFDVVPSEFEEHLDDSRSPQEVSIELGLGKARAVAKKYPDSIVIGSDTIVTIEGRQLEKPADMDEAHDMLKLLAGKTHDVTTSIAIIRNSTGQEFTGSETTKVTFKPYNEAAALAYLALNDSLDKAAGYGIQSGAAPLVAGIEGNYDCAHGLPTHLLAKGLAGFGIRTQPLELETPVFS